MAIEAKEKQEVVVRRRIIAVRPIEHRMHKGNAEHRGLSEKDRSCVHDMALAVKEQLLPGRTIIACTPTICGQEMAHLFSCEIGAILPIPCRSLNSRKPHGSEPHNLKALLNLIQGLVADNDNIILITHVGDIDEHQIFSSYFFEKHLAVRSQKCDIIFKGRIVAVDCQL